MRNKVGEMSLIVRFCLVFLFLFTQNSFVLAVEPAPFAKTFMKCRLKGKSPLKRYIGEIAFNGTGTASGSQITANDGFAEIELAYSEFKKNHDFQLAMLAEMTNAPTLQELVNGKVHKSFGTGTLVIQKAGLTRLRDVRNSQDSKVKMKLQIRDLRQGDDFENLASGRLAVQFTKTMFEDVDSGTIIRERPKNGKVTVVCKFEDLELK